MFLLYFVIVGFLFINGLLFLSLFVNFFFAMAIKITSKVIVVVLKIVLNVIYFFLLIVISWIFFMWWLGIWSCMYDKFLLRLLLELLSVCLFCKIYFFVGIFTSILFSFCVIEMFVSGIWGLNVYLVLGVNVYIENLVGVYWSV